MITLCHSRRAAAVFLPGRDTARAMTDEEMIAALRRVHDVFNRRDYEAVAELAHPDVELGPHRGYVAA